MTWLTLHPWSVIAIPFAIAFIVLGVIHGCEAYSRLRDRKALRIRDQRISRFGLGPISGTRDRWLS